jgi:hypothetical protein
MLQRLLEFGINEKFFEIKLLGQLDKSCCTNSKLEVIDYDKTKDDLSQKSEINKPKSSDALKIIPQLNCIDFIELKGFGEFINRNKNDGNVNEKINSQVKKFDLAQKIEDSLFVLQFIIRHKKFNCTKSEKIQYKQAIKNYIIVTDIDLYQNPANYRLAAYNHLRGDGSETIDTIKQEILNKLAESANDIPELENLNRAKVLNCREIDNYYEKLLAEVSN